MNKAEVLTWLICSSLITILLIGVGVGIYEWRSYAVWQQARISKVQKKCVEYIEFACKGLILNSYIPPPMLLRNEAIEGLFPHMAYLKISSGLATDNACGGTLISEYFVMTAAHCVQNVNVQQVLVKLGSVFSSNDSTGVWLKIDQIHVHESYKDASALHDIALLRLANKVELDKRIRPICLNVKNVDDETKNSIIASGWGLDETDEIASEHLQILNTYLDQSELVNCQKEWLKYYNKYMFCAGHPATRRSTCQINPGGSLQHVLKNGCANSYEQIAIASSSFNLNCTLNSSQTIIVIYTKVQPYIPWIADIVWPEE